MCGLAKRATSERASSPALPGSARSRTMSLLSSASASRSGRTKQQWSGMTSPVLNVATCSTNTPRCPSGRGPRRHTDSWLAMPDLAAPPPPDMTNVFGSKSLSQASKMGNPVTVLQSIFAAPNNIFI